MGGAGYIGSHVVRYLQLNGYALAVYDNFSSGHREVLSDLPVISAELGDAVSLSQFFREYEVQTVIHLAGPISVGESMRRPQLYFQNVSDSLVLLEAMRQANISQLIFSSSCAVYGTPQQTPITEGHALAPISPYGRSKLMIEFMLQDYARVYGLKYVALRYFNACGADPDAQLGERHQPETHLIPLILDVALGRRDCIQIFGDDYPTPDGTCIRDFVHVWELARVHECALNYLQRGGASTALNLGSGQGFSVKEVIQAAERVTRQQIRSEVAPRRPGDPPVLVSHSRRAQDLLGWRPEYDQLEDMLSSAWKFQRQWAS